MSRHPRQQRQHSQSPIVWDSLMLAPRLNTKIMLALASCALIVMLVFGVPAWAQETSLPLDKLAPLYQSQRDANAKQAQDMAAANAVLGQQPAEAQAKTHRLAWAAKALIADRNQCQSGC